MDAAPVAALVTLLMGTLSGSLGAMLGIGGGVFLVPFLILVVGLPFHQAAAVSLAAVIATSTAVSAATAGRQLINLRLGMVLEVATAAGGVAGGLTAQMLAAGGAADHLRDRRAHCRRRGRSQRRGAAAAPRRRRRSARRPIHRRAHGADDDLRGSPSAPQPVRVVSGRQPVHAARHRWRHRQGPGAGHLERRPDARRRGHQRVHDRRDRDIGRGHLLRPRRDDSGAGGGGRAGHADGIGHRPSRRGARAGPWPSPCCWRACSSSCRVSC